MRSAIVVNWWALAIRGVAGILLGIAALAWTGITLVVLIALFAAYLLVDGVFAAIAGVRGRSWLLVIEGVIGIAAAIVVVRWPGITALVGGYPISAPHPCCAESSTTSGSWCWVESPPYSSASCWRSTRQPA